MGDLNMALPITCRQSRQITHDSMKGLESRTKKCDLIDNGEKPAMNKERLCTPYMSHETFMKTLQNIIKMFKH